MYFKKKSELAHRDNLSSYSASQTTSLLNGIENLLLPIKNGKWIHRVKIVVKGTLFFGFSEENGDRSFVGGNATKGQTVIIPQGVSCATQMDQILAPGLIHFAQNLGCKEAQFIASFPHRDPGTQTTASAFFKLPISAIRATTGLSKKAIKKILASVEAIPNPSLDYACARRCGIKY